MSKNILFFLLLFTGIVHGQIVNIPDANFKTRLLAATVISGTARDLNNNYIQIDSNSNGEIEVSEAAQISFLSITSQNISNATGIEYFTNLRILLCSGNQLTSLDVSATQLTSLTCTDNQLTYLNLAGLSNLNYLNCSYNQLTSLDISDLTNLRKLLCNYNQITSLDATGLINLQEIECRFNALNSLIVSELTNLRRLYCSTNNLTQLEINTLIGLQSLDCAENDLTSLIVNNLTNLQSLHCRVNQLTSLDVSALNNLRNFGFSTNQISSLNVNMLINLEFLDCDSNPISELNISNLINLKTLGINSTQISILDLSPLANLQSFSCARCPITSLDLSELSELQTLSCYYTQISTLDVSSNTLLNFLNCGNDELITLNIKNGRNSSVNFFSSPNLEFVCADESEFSSIQFKLNQNGNINTVLNSYCSFALGGNYNTITGNAIYDSLSDGCGNDIGNPYIKLNINDETTTGSTFTNTTGNYTFYTQAGNFTVIPEVENPSYFIISPSSTTINFPLLDNTIQTQNFCITANGFHPDLEIVLVPIGAARPGFDATYKLIYKNKGNQALSGQVTVAFDDARTDFVSANPTVANQTIGNLTWNFTNLLPFETRAIDFTLNLNTPLEIPSLNNGDILHFLANTSVVIGEGTYEDNVFELNQPIVNSYDPNDKTCLEGNIIAPSDIGKYVHYNINFENIGTADAVNVVVKDIIDPTKFNINTLQLMYASHPIETKITGNIVEFIFEDINLPPSNINPIGGHGNVLFKIKTLPTLQVGDEIANSANIYFDYNAPIETNEARSVYQNLSASSFIKDESISVYPNPTKNRLSIQASSNLKSIELYDVQGRILQSKLEDKNATTFDISDRADGIYFLKINSEKGSSVEKIVKDN